jgi:hypothetical protein
MSVRRADAGERRSIPVGVDDRLGKGHRRQERLPPCGSSRAFIVLTVDRRYVAST